MNFKKLYLVILILFLFIEPIRADTINDYIMYYRLDENQGITAYNDNITGSYNGLWLGNNTQNWTTASWGVGGNFSPPNTSVISVASVPTITNNFSFSAQVIASTNASTSQMSILGTRSSTIIATDKSFDVDLKGGKYILADIGNGTSWINTSINVSFPYNANQLYNISMTVNQTSYKIYVDGLLIASSDYINYVASPIFTNPTHVLAIGNYRVISLNTNPKLWNGSINQLMIFDRVLNNNEVNLSNNISYNIFSCRYITSANITHTLINNLSSPVDCITIIGNNSILEGKGYIINGTDSATWYKGIDILGDNITVRNMTVRDFKSGLQVETGYDNISIKNMNLFSNYYGFYGGSSNINVSNNNVSDNAIGMRFSFIENGTILDNVLINASDTLIYMGDNTSQYNLFKNNTIFYPLWHGISEAGNYNTFSYNNFSTGNTADSISYTGNYVTINDNYVYGLSTGTGFDSNGGKHSNLYNNIVVNSTDGFELDAGSENNTIYNNTVNKSVYGVHLWSFHDGNPPTRNTIRDNIFVGTSSSNSFGIYIEGLANNNTIENNSITKTNLTGSIYVFNGTNNKGCGNNGSITSLTVNYVSNLTQPCYIWKSENLTGIGRLASNGTYIYNLSMTIIPASLPLNLTIITYNTSGDYRKVFNLSGSASITAGDFKPNTQYTIYKNGIKYNTYTSNASGFISFSDIISSETQYIISTITGIDAYTISTCASTLQWGTIGSALIILILIISAGGLALGFLTGNLNLNTFPLIEFVLVLIAVVVIGSIGVAIIEPIITLVGCP